MWFKVSVLVDVWRFGKSGTPRPDMEGLYPFPKPFPTHLFQLAAPELHLLYNN